MQQRRLTQELQDEDCQKSFLKQTPPEFIKHTPRWYPHITNVHHNIPLAGHTQLLASPSLGICSTGLSAQKGPWPTASPSHQSRTWCSPCWTHSQAWGIQDTQFRVWELFCKTNAFNLFANWLFRQLSQVLIRTVYRSEGATWKAVF